MSFLGFNLVIWINFLCAGLLLYELTTEFML
jgi:hypothetical protein